MMGIVNATPDSFSDGGMFGGSDDAVKYAIQLVADGADLLDVGASRRDLDPTRSRPTRKPLAWCR